MEMEKCDKCGNIVYSNGLGEYKCEKCGYELTVSGEPFEEVLDDGEE